MIANITLAEIMMALEAQDFSWRAESVAGYWTFAAWKYEPRTHAFVRSEESAIEAAREVWHKLLGDNNS